MYISPINAAGVHSPNKKYTTIPSFRGNLITKSTDEIYSLVIKIIEHARQNNAKGVFEACGIAVKENPDKTLTISHYCQPLDKVTFKTLGINEDELIQNVSVIEGVANFTGSGITRADKLSEAGSLISLGGKLQSLKSLSRIRETLDLSRNKYIKHLDSLNIVGKNLYIPETEIETMNGLKKVGSKLNAWCSAIREMKALQIIGGGGRFDYSEISDLSSLRKAGALSIDRAHNLTALDNLEECENDFSAYENSNLKSMSKFKKCGGSLYIPNSGLKNLPELEKCGKHLIVSGNNIELPKLKYCGGNICFLNSNLSKNDFANVKIAGDLVG